MKKFLSGILVVFLAGSVISIYAQECEIYKDYKEGTSVKMVHYDKKDKSTGYTVTTVKEKKSIPGGVSLLFHQQYDNNDDYTFESEFEVRCENGDILVDMGKMLDPNTMTAYENMEFDVKADDLSIPKNASPGDQLNDGAITVSVDTGTPVTVSITVTISDRKVESREKLTTPAGTFDCLKITYDMETKIGFMKVRSSAAEYFNSKNGVIKSESFNKKGKLTGYSVVEEIN